MRRPVVVQRLSARALKRRSAVGAAGRVFPAWIEAGEHVLASPAVLVLPRVRDALVLRPVLRHTGVVGKGGGDASGSR